MQAVGSLGFEYGEEMKKTNEDLASKKKKAKLKKSAQVS